MRFDVIDLFDGHCDTILQRYLYGGSLRRNEGHVDLERAGKYRRYAQFFALFGAAEDFPGRDLRRLRLGELFREEYIDADSPYQLVRHSFAEFTDEDGHSHVTFAGTLRHKETVFQVNGSGNGPIDAFFNAIHGQKMDRFTFVDYKEHAIKQGSDSQAVSYIHLKDQAGKDWFGVGISHNINLAPLKGILSAINRAVRHGE